MQNAHLYSMIATNISLISSPGEPEFSQKACRERTSGTPDAENRALCIVYKFLVMICNKITEIQRADTPTHKF